MAKKTQSSGGFMLLVERQSASNLIVTLQEQGPATSDAWRFTNPVVKDDIFYSYGTHSQANIAGFLSDNPNEQDLTTLWDAFGYQLSENNKSSANGLYNWVTSYQGGGWVNGHTIRDYFKYRYPWEGFYHGIYQLQLQNNLILDAKNGWGISFWHTLMQAIVCKCVFIYYIYNYYIGSRDTVGVNWAIYASIKKLVNVTSFQYQGPVKLKWGAPWHPFR